MPENGQPGSTLSSRLRRGSPNFVYGQVTLNASTATLIIAANSTRAGVLIVNLGAIDVWIGDSSVTTSTGTLLLGVKGSAISISTVAALYAIGTSGNPVVSYMDLYD